MPIYREKEEQRVNNTVTSHSIIVAMAFISFASPRLICGSVKVWAVCTLYII